MADLDYISVNRYWDQAQPSLLGPYMMDGFGFPDSAGRYRFAAETQIIERLTGRLDPTGTVLDLGSGIGHWAEYFAGRFTQVVAVEGSRPFYESLRERAVSHANIKAVQADVMEYAPEGRYEMIFLGGLLMYLNEADVISLLNRLRPLLNPGGIILCRESTVRKGSETRQGEYQATYRSVENYETLFQQCGLSPVRRELNAPYVLLQMGCEMVKVWKAMIPQVLQALPLVGCLVYGGLRLGNPWIARLPAMLGCNFPHLTNHFFLLQPASAKGRPGYAGRTDDRTVLRRA